jgi:hypothetical protein
VMLQLHPDLLRAALNPALDSDRKAGAAVVAIHAVILALTRDVRMLLGLFLAPHVLRAPESRAMARWPFTMIANPGRRSE